MERLSRLRASVAGAGGGVGFVGICAILAGAAEPGPRLVLELAGVLLVAAWIGLTARNLWRGGRLAAFLRSRSVVARVAGIDVRLLPGVDRQAFVLGALTPTIFLGAGLLESLDEEELRAVVLHEEFHRRSRGPLRSASIEAWMTLLQPLSPAHATLADRLVDLERAADRYAVASGVAPVGIASALLKIDRAAPFASAAFSSAADRRVGALLALAMGTGQPADRPPYEWLAAAAAASTFAACQLVSVVSGLSAIAA